MKIPYTKIQITVAEGDIVKRTKLRDMIYAAHPWECSAIGNVAGPNMFYMISLETELCSLNDAKRALDAMCGILIADHYNVARVTISEVVFDEVNLGNRLRVVE